MHNGLFRHAKEVAFYNAGGGDSANSTSHRSAGPTVMSRSGGDAGESSCGDRVTDEMPGTAPMASMILR